MEQPKGVNILITGTPGTGKTTMAASIAQELDNFEHIEVGKLVKEHKFFSSYDEEFDTHIIEEDDEDRLLDYMEPLLTGTKKNVVVDYHSSELFPERWFHLVIVLKTATEKLYERLQTRHYNETKCAENMEAEIMCVCEEEAKEAYKEDAVIVCVNDTLEEMVATIDLIRDRVEEIKVAKGFV
ncbi:LOW QUALITY PROTEIN: adenylate kinase isoenzyme 6 homolog [Bactrocera neohumeralis]|uniref:LOW QUALITY PROTEIN: adenylate kinase isoenzyme 6 homolog n=1 Tax=Bactrocera neohumeralis TaxID=98809 RepID=UPI002165F2C1|nr:LOW QUALITY PROTEIN: adenylate kinase isoenzyme 6 homolog [Bactrocera neohumeralis]